MSKECFLEPKCGEECKTVDERKCSTVQEQQCRTVQEQQCDTVQVGTVVTCMNNMRISHHCCVLAGEGVQHHPGTEVPD